ncbi:hypothetical protein CRM22_007132 [Opisthorchis felineus]|uniref:C-type lectin domain-containing protein n=1 Tax=Opisthorchis felineus TaxID=147828 RepID=A0A4S2LHE9_OPIFE|nr:hypothetical protein CRM22_007132 [Opisthorchis felineus]
MSLTTTFVTLFQLVTVQTQCPPGFILGLNGKCFVEFRGSSGFCDANKRCADLGEEKNASIFMLGKSFDDLIWSELRETGYNHYWTSINGLLIKPTSCFDKWRVGYPSAQTLAYENCVPKWGEVYKGQSSNRLTVGIVDRLYSAAQGGKGARVICELGDPKLPDQLAKFQSTFPETIADYFFHDQLHEGCFAESSVSSLMSCAMKPTIEASQIHGNDLRLRRICNPESQNLGNHLFVYTSGNAPLPSLKAHAYRTDNQFTSTLTYAYQ